MPRFVPAVVVVAAFGAALIAAPASAGEVFGGVYAHAVQTPLSLNSSKEGGVDFQLGYRGKAIALGLEPYAFGALNTKGDTSYAAVGLSRKFGDRFFVRPGLGIAIHNGETNDFTQSDRIALGSRVLFEPEIALGVRISPRATIEASWIHLSHGRLFGGQNPGIDNIGARFSVGL